MKRSTATCITLILLVFTCSIQAQWRELTSGPYDNRIAVNSYYDGSRGVLVLFFKGNGEQEPGDVWEWNGAGWKFVSEFDEKARPRYPLVYDPSRGVAVLYAGHSGRTWMWDDNSWRGKRIVGPGVRLKYAIAYDPKQGKVILNGGVARRFDSSFNDTWEWDGQEWKEVGGSRPSGRYGHLMAYDPINGAMLIQGGIGLNESGTEPLADTWILKSDGWHRMAGNGPKNASFLFSDEPGNSLHLIDLTVGSESLWEWDGNNWRKTDIALPEELTADSLLSNDPATGTVSFYNRSGTSIIVWNGEKFNVLERDWPGPVSRGSLAHDFHRDRFILFGGGNHWRNFSGPRIEKPGITYEWDGQAWHTVTTTGPENRHSGSMVYHAGIRRTILFGGLGARLKTLGKTWLWNGRRWKTLKFGSSEKVPHARAGHAMAYDSDRNVIVLFGGYYIEQDYDYFPERFLQDTWEFDGKSWEKVNAEGPDPRAYHAMTYDSKRKKVILVGGEYFTDTYVRGGFPQVIEYSDTWEWDGGSWSPVAKSGPGRRAGHSLVYDPSRGESILFGGRRNADSNPWAWNGSNWRKIRTRGRPEARTRHAAVFDATRGQMLIIGGIWGGITHSDMWQFIPY